MTNFNLHVAHLFDRLPRRVQNWRPVSRLRWPLVSTLARYGTAWRYARGRMTVDDAWSLTHAAEEVHGYYGLEGIDRDTVLEQAIERYGDVPELPELVDRACARVAHKWNSSGDTASAAEDWAFDLIASYAEQDGIRLNDSWDAHAEDEDAETEDAT